MKATTDRKNFKQSLACFQEKPMDTQALMKWYTGNYIILLLLYYLGFIHGEGISNQIFPDKNSKLQSSWLVAKYSVCYVINSVKYLTLLKVETMGKRISLTCFLFVHSVSELHTSKFKSRVSSYLLPNYTNVYFFSTKGSIMVCMKCSIGLTLF